MLRFQVRSRRVVVREQRSFDEVECKLHSTPVKRGYRWVTHVQCTAPLIIYCLDKRCGRTANNAPLWCLQAPSSARSCVVSTSLTSCVSYHEEVIPVKCQTSSVLTLLQPSPLLVLGRSFSIHGEKITVPLKFVVLLMQRVLEPSCDDLEYSAVLPAGTP